MTSLDYGLDMPYEVQLEHDAATATTHMTILESQRSPGYPATRHLLSPGVYMVSLAYNGAQRATLQHVGGGTTNTVSVPAGVAGNPRTSAPIKVSVQGTTEYLQVAAASSTGGTARATISVIPAPTFDEMAESAQGVSVLSEINTLKTTKADKSTLDARIPSDLALRVDTTVGTRIFAGDTMIYGDTGLRALVLWDTTGNITYGTMPTGMAAESGKSGGIWIQRVHDRVTMYISGAIATADSGLIEIPSRFHPNSFPYPIVLFRVSYGVASASIGGGKVYTSWTSGKGMPGASQVYATSLTWHISEPWPTSLPGLPA